MKKKIILIILSVFCTNLYAQQIIYVDQNATGANNGTTWTDAFTDLQTAIEYSDTRSNPTVWVAQGTYYPSKTVDGSENEQKKVFSIENTWIYGGFSGNEVSLNERYIENYETILSGDIGIKGEDNDNVECIILGKYYNLIDGFTITKSLNTAISIQGEGVVRNNKIINNNGLGLEFHSSEITGFAIGTTITISKNVINNNKGAIKLNKVEIGIPAPPWHGYGGFAYIANNIISFNDSDKGAAISTNCNCEITDNYITNNSAQYGGAIYFNSARNEGLTNMLYKNYIFNNTASNDGGAIYTSYTTLFLVENIIYNNRANINGGGIYFKDSYGVIEYCNVISNTAQKEGAGIYSDCGYPIQAQQISNTIFWENLSETNFQIDTKYAYNDDNLQNCVVQNGISHLQGISYQNIILENPLFTDIDNGDFYLKPNSPAINTGMITEYLPETDFEGNERVIDDMVDIGAYEYTPRYAGQGYMKTVCAIQTETYTITATTSENKTGAWSITEGNATLSNYTALNTQAINLTQGKNVFRYTITGNPLDYTEIIINYYPVSEAEIIIPNQTVCKNSIQLSATESQYGTGQWFDVKGSTIINENSSHLQVGENVFELRVTNGECTNAAQLSITYNPAKAEITTPNQTVCENSIQLSATEPQYGTGQWFDTKGNTIINDNSTHTHLQVGENVFEWKVTNGECTDAAQLSITYTPAKAEIITPNQTVCENSIQLSASEPLYGTGKWYKKITNTTFANNTTVNLSVGDNIFEWQVTNGECSDAAQLSITYNPIIAEVHVEQADCKLNPAGQITVNATGGNGSLAYSKDNGLSFETNKNIFNDLTAGIYHIKIKDSENCVTDLGAQEIEELILPEITDVQFIEFENGNLAKYKINIEGGTEPFNIWLNDEITPNEIIEGLTAGNYTVKVQDHKGCEAVYSFNVINTQISDNIEQHNIKIYPNPANKEITIEINNSNNNETKIEIYDALGRLRINKTTKQKTIKIDTNELKSGIYFVKTSNNLTIKTLILMVNRME